MVSYVINSFSGPALNVVGQDIERMAERAVALTLDGQREPTDHFFPTQLVVRESCGCRHPAAGVATEPSA